MFSMAKLQWQDVTNNCLPTNSIQSCPFICQGSGYTINFVLQQQQPTSLSNSFPLVLEMLLSKLYLKTNIQKVKHSNFIVYYCENSIEGKNGRKSEFDRKTNSKVSFQTCWLVGTQLRRKGSPSAAACVLRVLLRLSFCHSLSRDSGELTIALSDQEECEIPNTY